METKGIVGIAERIRHIMDENRLNYSKLAKIAGVTPQTINLLANGGITDPKVSTIINIANEFNIDLNWLLLGEGNLEVETVTVPLEMEEFYKKEIQARDQQLFDTKRQLFEKDKLIARFKNQMGKLSGVFDQPGLMPIFA